MKIETLNMNGNGKSLEIPEKIFLASVNKKLISHLLYSYIGNAKPRLAKTKQKNEITGSTAKIYAQKGTGNARHASRKAPLFVGGGVAHGPKGGGNYKLRKLNKKEKKIGIISILSQKNKDKNILVFENFTKEIKKTKEFYNTIKKFNIFNSLFILDDQSKKNIEMSAKNIPNIKLTSSKFINMYDLLKFKQIVFTTTSIKNIEESYR